MYAFEGSKSEAFCCRLVAVTVELEALERLMQERRSERQFLPTALPAGVVERLLLAAISAPSASNRQPYRFMVVQRPETIARMVETVETVLRTGERAEVFRERAELADYGKHFVAFGRAPVVFVVFYRENGLFLSVRENLSSAAAAIMQLLLAVHALGLGACWMTGPCVAEKELLELLHAPPGLRLAALVPVGYCANRAEVPQKRKLSQLMIPEPLNLVGAGAISDWRTSER